MIVLFILHKKDHNAYFTALSLHISIRPLHLGMIVQ